MKSVLLTTFGSLGDLYPYIAVALELRHLGYDVKLATDNWHRLIVEKEEIEFIPIRPEVSKIAEADPKLMSKLMDANGGPEYVVRRLVLEHLRDSYEDYYRASANADLIVTHPLTFGAIMAAQKRELPWVSSILAPLSMFSKFDLPSMPNAPWISKLTPLGPGVTGFMINQMKSQTIKWFTPLFKLRDELGLPAIKHPLFEGQFSPYLHLALFSGVLSKPQPDWPPRTHITGFPFFKGMQPSKSDMDRLYAFLAAGPAPITFTLGSSAVWDSGPFYEQSVEACRQLGQRAILLAGPEKWQQLQEKFSSAQVSVFEYLPHSVVFPESAAVVHQSGIGTCAQALRSGVPQLIVPFAHDQPDNARRVADLGVARVLPRNRLSSANLVKQLRALLDDSGTKKSAAMVSEMVRAEDGARTAAYAIHSLMKS